jgi:hypothetical protein
MTDTEIHDSLINVADRYRTQDVTALKDALAKSKADAVLIGDEEKAKTIWSLQHVLRAQCKYVSGFAHCKLREFYSGWCAFEHADVTLCHLKKHFAQQWEVYGLAFIEKQIRQFQSLFPYKIFMSTGMVVKERQCSACGISFRMNRRCTHKKGEIYAGEMCCDIISSFELVEISCVEDPVDRCCVAFLDDGNGASSDKYDYSAVAFIVDRLRSPFHDWTVRETFRIEPFDKHPAERNDMCPCASGLKFKRCCLSREGIRFPHRDVQFEVSPPVALPNLILPGDGKVMAVTARPSSASEIWARLAVEPISYPGSGKKNELVMDASGE